MASDQLVSAKLILESVLELQRRGRSRTLEDLEKIEPDLAEFLIENLSLVHQKLLAIGARPKETLRLQRRIEGIVVVAVMSLRKAHYQLWQNSMGAGLEEPDADGESLLPESDPGSPG